MTLVKFLISPEFGCCTSSELMHFNKQDPRGYALLKEWAAEEMRNRKIAIDEPAK